MKQNGRSNVSLADVKIMTVNGTADKKFDDDVLRLASVCVGDMRHDRDLLIKRSIYVPVQALTATKNSVRFRGFVNQRFVA